jgi:general secretion pathway protein G
MNTTTNLTKTVRRGFTLIEIIVVVMIIAVLATIIVPRVLEHVGSAKHSTAQSKANAIADAIILYQLSMGLSQISNDFDLEVLLLPPDDGGSPTGPQLNKQDDIIDPWGRPFEVIVPGEVNHDFDVVSWGEDGEPGGEGANEDVTQ